MAKYNRSDGTRDSLRQSFEDNSAEAWEQICMLLRRPLFWIILVLFALLLTGGIFVYRFLDTVRAPELTPHFVVTQRGGETPQEAETIEEQEVYDYSNAVQPLIDGNRKENFYTFLLFGTDAEGTNTDTIMVVSYDVQNQKLNIMSIPRDTMVNVPWDIKKINSVYGRWGLKAMKKQIGKLIGFTPDFYVKIDLQAFVDVVDLIGGVEFDVPIPMHYHDPYQNLSIDLEPGLQTLNGEQAMGLVRFRKSDRGSNGVITGYDDTGRVQTQQAFLKAMFKKCVKLTNWTKISSYVEIFQRNVESDLELGNMLWFARQAMDLGENGLMTVTAPGNYYASAWSRSTESMQSYVTIYGNQMVRLVNESFNPYIRQVNTGNLDIMGINSDGSVYSSTGSVADAPSALPVVPEEDPEDAEEPDDEDTGDGEKPAQPEDGEPVTHRDGEAEDGTDGSESRETEQPSEGSGEQQPAEGTPAETGPVEASQAADPHAEEPAAETPTVEPPAAAEPPQENTGDTTPTESGAQ